MFPVRYLHRTIRLVAVLSAMLCLPTELLAQSAIALTPNIKPLPAANFSLVESGRYVYAAVCDNEFDAGAGALQLEAGPVDTGNGKQQVYQRVFNNDGSPRCSSRGGSSGTTATTISTSTTTRSTRCSR